MASKGAVVLAFVALVHSITSFPFEVKAAPKCPSNDALLPNPDDCGTYYICDNGRPVLQPCPAGLHFNVEAQTCDLPENAHCNENTPKPTTTSPTTDPQTTPEPTNEPDTTPDETTDPQTTPEPTSKPDTTPDETTDPQTTPEPTSEPETTPDETTDPQTTPEPTSEPDTTPDETTDPQTTPEPTSEPDTTPDETTDPQTTPEPTSEPETTPDETTDPQTTPEPTSEPETTPDETTDPQTTPETTNEPETTPGLTTEESTSDLPGTIPPTTEPPLLPECPPKGTLTLPNPYDCASFYVCVNGLSAIINCPAGLHWSEEYEMCMSPAEAQCPLSTTETPVTTTTEPEEPEGCPVQGIAVLPNPGDCSSFIVCINGNSAVFPCPDGLDFNAVEKTCQPPQQANCQATSSERPETTTEDTSEITTEEELQTTTEEEPQTTEEEPLTTTEEEHQTTTEDEQQTTTEEEPQTTEEEPGTTTEEEPQTTTEDEQQTTTEEEPQTTTEDEQQTTTEEEQQTTEEEPGTTTEEEPQTTTEDEQQTTTEEEPQTTTEDEQQTTTEEEQQTTEEEPGTTTEEEPQTTTEGDEPETSSIAPPETTTTPTSPECPSEGKYTVPNPEDCGSFYVCINGLSALINCPDELHFNAETERCDLPENANCQQLTTEAPFEPDCPPEGSALLPNPQDCTSFYVCINQFYTLLDCPAGLNFDAEDLVCEGSNEAQCAGSRRPHSRRCDHEGELLANPEDCTTFFMCTNGQAILFDCPNGLFFNAEAGVCDIPTNTQCISGNSTTPPTTVTDSTVSPPTNGTDPTESPSTNGTDSTENPPTNGTDPTENPPTNGTDPTENPPTNGTDPTENPPTNGTDPTENPPTNGTDPTENPPTNGTDPTPSPNGPNCPSSGTSILPNPYDCGSFFVCIEGNSALVNCSEGFEFNADLGACVVGNGTCVASTVEPPSTPPLEFQPDCPANGTAFLPNPNDCASFYVCINGDSVVVNCPTGLQFSNQTGSCVSENLSDCASNNETTSTTPTPTQGTNTTDEATSTTEPTSPTAKPSTEPTTTDGTPTQCPPSATGEVLLPNPNDCASYYVCDNGTPTLLPCPPGLHFNPILHLCDLPQLAGCQVVKTKSRFPLFNMFKLF